MKHNAFLRSGGGFLSSFVQTCLTGAENYESGGREFESSPVRQFFIIFQRIKNLYSDLPHFCRATLACGPRPDISMNPKWANRSPGLSLAYV
jgi:hypothetical protein